MSRARYRGIRLVWSSRVVGIIRCTLAMTYNVGEGSDEGRTSSVVTTKRTGRGGGHRTTDVRVGTFLAIHVDLATDISGRVSYTTYSSPKSLPAAVVNHNNQTRRRISRNIGAVLGVAVIVVGNKIRITCVPPPVPWPSTAAIVFHASNRRMGRQTGN